MAFHARHPASPRPSTRAPAPPRRARWRTPALAVLAGAALAACGGGGSGVTELPTSVAQGYAADAGTMPAAAFGALDAVGASLDDALAAGAVAAAQAPADARRQALAVTPLEVTRSATCAGGGSMTWTVTGGTDEQQRDGRLDTGERYDIAYDQCVTADGPTLDGAIVLDVTLRTPTTDDLNLSTEGLTATSAGGGARFLLAGQLRNERTRTPLESGRAITGRFTSGEMTLDSTLGARNARYTLQSLDWSVTRTFDADDRLAMRAHEGSLQMTARTPRRPDATLDIATAGALEVGDDGYAANGGLTLTTAANRWAVTWALPATVTIEYDAGQDGVIDRTWTLTRQTMLDLAG
jgi:hypothetical protein